MNITDKFFSPSKHLRIKWRRNPERDWVNILAISTVALIGVIIWNMRTFDVIANGGVIGPAATSSSVILNKSSIDAIHDVFDKRATEELKYRTGAYRFSDPSQ
jgi:hypothetical protein